MKARKGFVSNSSTSSFCIFGCEVTDEIHKKAMELLLKDEEEETER